MNVLGSLNNVDSLALVALYRLLAKGLKEPPKYGGQRENDATKVWLIHAERWIESQEVLNRQPIPDKARIALATSYFEKTAAA